MKATLALLSATCATQCKLCTAKRQGDGHFERVSREHAAWEFAHNHVSVSEGAGAKQCVHISIIAGPFKTPHVLA